MIVDLERFDVCYVMNVHGGRNYLARTMQSIEMAARHARQHGLRTELLFILDSSPSSTVEWVESFSSNAFERIRIESVTNASLGLSRQDGLRLSSAEYIQFCDEDDLVSENTTTACYDACANADHKTIAVPEYLFAFGSLSYLAHYSGSADVSPLLFISQHPFISRIFVHHSIIQLLRYEDVAAGNGYAFEDWLFNCSAVAHGFKYVVAQDTILFYRQRAAGLLQASSASSIRLPPPNKLFEPAVYVAVCRASFWMIHRGETPVFDGREMCERFMARPMLRSYVEAANAIDPGINSQNLQQGPLLSNRIGDFRTGQAYFNACKKVLCIKFSDAIISSSVVDPSLAAVTVSSSDVSRRQVLVLLSGAASSEIENNCIPTSSTVISLPSLAHDLTDEHMDVVALRLVEASAASARIHLSASEFSYRFLRKFCKVLKSNQIIFHHSSESGRSLSSVERGAEFGFISEFWDYLDVIVCPDQRFVEGFLERVDRAEPKWNVPIQEEVRNLATD